MYRGTLESKKETFERRERSHYPAVKLGCSQDNHWLRDTEFPSSFLPKHDVSVPQSYRKGPVSPRRLRNPRLDSER